MVFAAVVLSALVVAVNSIVTTSRRGPDAAVTYADQVRPAVDRSTRQAAAVDDVRANVATLESPALRRTLERLVREGKALVEEVRELSAPSDLDVAHGLLVTVLSTRHSALDGMRRALTADPSTPADESTATLETAGRDLVVSDRAYQLFLEALPPTARRTMPASTWVPDATRWERPEMAALVATARASASAVPVHDVAVVTVTPTPSPVGADPSGAQVLPKTRSLRLDVVVANAGNAPERRVAVEAVVTTEGGMDTARQFVDLAPGQRQSVGLTLQPAAGPGMTLQVKTVPVNGEERVADNAVTLTYVVR
ncbi:MAG TPA: hypothetical protein VF230_05470 [Acidimicrobiales bacterium]